MARRRRAARARRAGTTIARLCGPASRPSTTSAGRLFDAVAALCGVRTHCTYEGQAAIELEALADPAEPGAYAFDGLDARPVVAQVLADRDDPAAVSARFHRGLAEATADALPPPARRPPSCPAASSRTACCCALTTAACERRGLRVLTPRRLPANDGGISYGQAAVAAAQ